MLPEQTDNSDKAKNKLHVFIGSVSNTKTEKRQQKLAVILCRIEWKNIDMQTTAVIFLTWKQQEKLGNFFSVLLLNYSF